MTENKDIEMIPVVSSNLEAVGYDEESRELSVRFHGGALYRYQDVPEDVYRGLLEAGSPGRFLNSDIKGKYDYEKAG